MIEIKQEYNYTTYLFTSPLWIDSNYEVTMNSEAHDSFVKLLQAHNIKDYKTTRTIPAKYNRNPRGSKDAAKAPVNMPNKGAYPK